MVPFRYPNRNQPKRWWSQAIIFLQPFYKVYTVLFNNETLAALFCIYLEIPGPVTFSTGSPTTVVTSSQNGANNGLLQPKKELDSPATPQTQRRIMQNSFDIMNPLVIDETGPTETSKKLKQPPMVFRSGKLIWKGRD